MYLTIWIISGIIAGWLIGLVIKGRGFGLISYLLVGALIGLIGGWIFSMFGIFANYWIRSIFVGVIGGIILIAIIRTILKRQ